jgi:hypothetical protein
VDCEIAVAHTCDQGTAGEGDLHAATGVQPCRPVVIYRCTCSLVASRQTHASHVSKALPSSPAHASRMAASDCLTLCTAHQLDGKPVGVFSGKGLNGQAWEWLVLLSRRVEDLAGGRDASLEAVRRAMQRAPLRIHELKAVCNAARLQDIYVSVCVASSYHSADCMSECIALMAVERMTDEKTA